MSQDIHKIKSLPELSEKLLYAVKLKEDTTEYQLALNSLPISSLLHQLNSESYKKTFWINIYNAFFQILRGTIKVPKKDIYTVKLINIGNESFSLDDIEHGILRKYRYKYSLGLFPNPFTPTIIKRLAVDAIDYRIHFALNCGAESCPPIAFYSADKLDDQLDLAARSFLDGESKIDPDQKTIHTSALLKWFKYDFGGRKGINKMFKDLLDKDISQYKLKYNDYSWDEQLDNFVH